MAIVIVISREDKTDLFIREVPVTKKLVVGQSGYCDVVLEDKAVASMQCEISPVKTGHVMIKNLDSKKEMLLNQTKIRKANFKSSDILKIGPFILTIDPSKLTAEELEVINTEYEEYI